MADVGISGLTDAEPIGSGGNAVVYRAYDTHHDRWVAVKLLRGIGDDAELRRFDRERRAMGRLSEHEGIVTIHSSGINERGEPYLVMTLLEQGSLQDRIDDHGAVPWPEAVELMAIVARTVHSAHQQDVIHRDLKPANIMLSRSGFPLVADFWIAKHTGSSASIQSSAITLTPAYSPPEVIEGAEASVSADVYALGATLFALLAGSPPFVTSSDENLFALMLRVSRDPVRDLRPDGVPNEVCAAIERAMAKAPADRYATAADFALALDSVANLSLEPPGEGKVSSASGPAMGVGAPRDDETVLLKSSPETAPESDDEIRSSTRRLAGSTTATSGGELRGPSTANETTGDGRSKRGRLVGVLIVLLVIAGVGVLVIATSSGGDTPATTELDSPEIGVEPESVFEADGATPVVDSVVQTEAAASEDPVLPEIATEAPVGADGNVIAMVDAAFLRFPADGSEPIDVTAALDEFSPGHDQWVVSSRNGEWLMFDTERFGCQDFSCLVVARTDLAEIAVVRVADELVHPQDWGSISDDGSTVVITTDGGGNDLDQAILHRTGDVWTPAAIITGASPHAFNERGRFTLDGEAILFDCGPTQYGLEGTGVCRVSLDGSSFERIVAPDDGADATSSNSARSADEGPDGGLVFEADWGNVERLWRKLPDGTTTLVSGLGNDNSPCVLPDGSVASVWLERDGNNVGLNELKIQASDSMNYEMLLIDVDVISQVQCGG